MSMLVSAETFTNTLVITKMPKGKFLRHFYITLFTGTASYLCLCVVAKTESSNCKAYVSINVVLLILT